MRFEDEQGSYIIKHCQTKLASFIFTVCFHGKMQCFDIIAQSYSEILPNINLQHQPIRRDSNALESNGGQRLLFSEKQELGFQF